MFESVTDAKILIVDDMMYNLLLMEDILQTHGYKNIEKARSGKEALERICKNKPHLVLLDIVLPDISGLDICKGIKETKKTHDIIVLIQSAQSSNGNKRKAFDLGANDFINKPIDETELVSRVKVQLNQLKLYGAMHEANQRMESELNDASKMMASLIPSGEFLDKIANDHNICIAAYYKPSSELGGDFYDVLDLNKNNIGLYVWDFAGHGVGAAINTFRLHSIINEKARQNVTKPGEFLTQINQALYRMLSPAQFATMFYGVLDTKTRKLRYSCASCPSPLLISFKTGKTKFIEAKEFPLGIQDKSDFTSKEISVKDWDVLILYSDALTETENANKEFWELDDLADFLIESKKSHKGAYDAGSIKEDIINKFNAEYAENLRDDLTLKVITFDNCKSA